MHHLQKMQGIGILRLVRYSIRILQMTILMLISCCNYCTLGVVHNFQPFCEHCTLVRGGKTAYIHFAKI